MENLAMVDRGLLNVRTTPSLNAKILTVLSRGTEIQILDIKDGWAKINLPDSNDTVGFVMVKFLSFND